MAVECSVVKMVFTGLFPLRTKGRNDRAPGLESGSYGQNKTYDPSLGVLKI